MKIALISEAAQLIGDPARANMLFALKDDGEIAAGELAAVAGVAPSTASAHLARLVAAGLVRMRVAGRRRFYRLAGAPVAEVLESIEGVANVLSAGGLRPREAPEAERHARCCYDHVAGRLGVGIAEAMLARRLIAPAPEGAGLTAEGEAWLGALGIAAAPLRRAPRRFLRLCPDWSEGAVHVGGAVGAALLERFQERDWVRRARGGTALTVTPAGAAGLREALGLDARAGATPGG